MIVPQIYIIPEQSFQIIFGTPDLTRLMIETTREVILQISFRNEVLEVADTWDTKPNTGNNHYTGTFKKTRL